MQKEVSVSESCKDGGVLPNSGFPRDGGMAKEGHRKDDSVTVQTYGTSHTTKHSFTGVVSAVIPSKRAFSERFESSREVVVHVAMVVEVVILVVVVEVVVHGGGGSCSRSWRVVM